MLTQGKPGAPIWFVVDDEVIAGRLVSITASADAGPSGLRVLCEYREPSRCACPRSNFAEYVFHDQHWRDARRLADAFYLPGNPLEAVGVVA